MSCFFSQPGRGWATTGTHSNHDSDVDDDGGDGDGGDGRSGDDDGDDGEGGDGDGDDGEQQGGEKEEQLGVEATTCLMGTSLASILLAIFPQPPSTSTS